MDRPVPRKREYVPARILALFVLLLSFSVFYGVYRFARRMHVTEARRKSLLSAPTVADPTDPVKGLLRASDLEAVALTSPAITGADDNSFSRMLARFFRTGRFGRTRRSAESRREALRRAEAAYEAQFKDTAFITFAVGDAAAKHAVALLQEMRDMRTIIPRLIVLMSRGGMGSDDCHNETKRNARGRHYRCSSQYAEPDDIVSQIYLDAFARLGAEVRIIEEIPNTMYTSMIPGGRATFWGMSFNKMRIFDMVEFKKVLFADADVMVLRNIDHIMLEPDFTAAFTTECCNGGARGKLGGGLWVFEPSHARWNYTQALINTPCPDADMGTWVHADMDVVNYMFCDIREGESFEQWPFTRDLRQGVLPGLRNIPQYRDISEGDYNRLVGFPTSGLPAPEGLLPQHANKRGIWHMLPTLFDGLVGNCECLGDRDMWDLSSTVHFSCMQVFSKPGHIHTDWDFHNTVYHRGKSCSRWYYMKWYDNFKRGMGGVGYRPPNWDGPPVPLWNKTHDDLVQQWRDERAKKEAEEEARTKEAEMRMKAQAAVAA
jgi:hypothetical protein